ncbi:hypothetical protein EBQ90_12695 [bacterium]|nr:hypothetical protein [bacterium]
MNKMTQLRKSFAVFSLGVFCGVTYLISCGQTTTASGTSTWINSYNTCANGNPTARLCTIDEWQRACTATNNLTGKFVQIWLLERGPILYDNMLYPAGAWVSGEDDKCTEPEIAIISNLAWNAQAHTAMHRCCFR